VRQYVRAIRVSLDEKLAAANSGEFPQRDGFSLDTLLNVAIEHRQMHVETLAYMLHQLPLERKVRQPAAAGVRTSPLTPAMVRIPSGVTGLGLSRQSGVFGWDNEFEAHTQDVPAFEIDRYMVSNGQFLEFLEAGGYERHDLWSDSDWEWKNQTSVSAPIFWRRRDGDWFYRTMFDEIPLPFDWPVYVSQAEASAYARWAGKALPSEKQWQRAAYGSTGQGERFYPWGDDAPTSKQGNFDFQSWDPMPVQTHPRGRSGFGVEAMLGNGWEWTSTVFAPFPGFEPFPFYRGYSADFFDGKHFVMKGGSSRTAACMLRPTFRNWFQSHYQYVYAGFRCTNE
jgi:ergothioneine biosynthesis protein EgtB